MAIRKELTLGWNGKEYNVLITMDIIDKIEDSVNLLKIAEQLRSGDVRFSKVARLYAILLNEAGAKVEVQEVYQGMFGDGGASIDDVAGILEPVFSAIFPDPEKKQKAPRKKAKS